MAWSVSVCCTSVKELSSHPQHTYLRGKKKAVVWCGVLHRNANSGEVGPGGSLELTGQLSYRIRELQVQ